ncbi:unnamed protein product, partial [Prorocentrum cordatum]
NNGNWNNGQFLGPVETDGASLVNATEKYMMRNEVRQQQKLSSQSGGAQASSCKSGEPEPQQEWWTDDGSAQRKSTATVDVESTPAPILDGAPGAQRAADVASADSAVALATPEDFPQLSNQIVAGSCAARPGVATPPEAASGGAQDRSGVDSDG